MPGGAVGAPVRFRTSHGIVPALDVDSVEQLRQVVAQTCTVPGVVAYKLGLAGVLRLGLGRAVAAIRELTDLPVLYDHQKAGADIPDMAAKFVAVCREAGVDALILFPLAGPEAVRAFVGHTRAAGLLAIVGGELPHDGYRASEGGYVRDDAAERIFALAAELGADHFVVPANRPEAIRRYVARLRAIVARPALFLPGVGPLGGSVTAAFTAAPGCACYAIVGRAIYAAPEPTEAARRLAEEALRFAA